MSHGTCLVPQISTTNQSTLGRTSIRPTSGGEGLPSPLPPSLQDPCPAGWPKTHKNEWLAKRGFKATLEGRGDLYAEPEVMQTHCGSVYNDVHCKVVCMAAVNHSGLRVFMCALPFDHGVCNSIVMIAGGDTGLLTTHEQMQL